MINIKEKITLEFPSGKIEEFTRTELEALYKELHSDLGKLLSKSRSEEDHPIMEWSKDWKTPNVFGPDPNIIYYYNQPIAQPLNEMFTNKNVLKDAYDTWLKADISSFNWKADTVSFTKIPTDLNVEVKTADENIVTKRNLYTTRTPDCC